MTFNTQGSRIWLYCDDIIKAYYHSESERLYLRSDIPIKGKLCNTNSTWCILIDIQSKEDLIIFIKEDLIISNEESDLMDRILLFEGNRDHRFFCKKVYVLPM